jgi:hypothetical protein
MNADGTHLNRLTFHTGLTDSGPARASWRPRI